MPFPFIQDQPSEETYQGLTERLPIGLQEQVQTSFMNELTTGGVTSKIYDLYKKSELENQPGRVLSPEELNQKYQGLGLSFSEPQKEQVAEYVADRQRKKIYNDKKVESGPDSYLSHGLRLGAGIAAHLADPTELAVTVGTAGLFRLGIAAKYGAQAVSKAGLAGRLGLGAAEGVIGQVALEPGEYLFDKEFARDYSAVEALERVGFGAGMGSVLEGGGYALSRLMKRMKGNAGRAAQDIALSQLDQGRLVDVAPIVESIEREAFQWPGSRPLAPGAAQPLDFSGRLNYQFRHFDQARPGGEKVYLGTKSSLEDFNMLSRDHWGDAGMVSHPGLAHADAANHWNDASGNIFEMTLADTARLASSSQVLTLPEKKLILDAINSFAQKGDVNFKNISRAYERGGLELNTLGDALNVVRSFGVDDKHLIDAMKPTLEAAGFHGVHVEVNESGAQLNRFEFFDDALKTGKNNAGEALFKDTRALSPDNRLMPEFTPVERADRLRQSMQKDFEILPEERIELDEIESKFDGTDESFDAHLDEADLEVKEYLKQLEAEVKDNPELEKLLEVSREVDNVFAEETKGVEKMLKYAMSCVGKNGV